MSMGSPLAIGTPLWMGTSLLMTSLAICTPLGIGASKLTGSSLSIGTPLPIEVSVMRGTVPGIGSSKVAEWGWTEGLVLTCSVSLLPRQPISLLPEVRSTSIHASTRHRGISNMARYGSRKPSDSKSGTCITGFGFRQENLRCGQ